MARRRRWRCLAIGGLMAAVGCARDNPAYDAAGSASSDTSADGKLDGDGTAAKTTASPTSGASADGSAGDGGEVTGLDGATMTDVDSAGPSTDTAVGLDAPPACPDTHGCPNGTECDAGYKCTRPWEGGMFSDPVCAPLQGTQGPFDACTVDTCGFDDCNDLGTCAPRPDGVDDVCLVPCRAGGSCPVHTCVDGVCRPPCNPLAQDGCLVGDNCLVTMDTSDCAPAGGVDPGQACDFATDCGAGLYCAPADMVPFCPGTTGCCTQLCNLDDAGVDAECSALFPGTSCVSLMLPPPLDNVGACLM